MQALWVFDDDIMSWSGTLARAALSLCIGPSKAIKNAVI